MIFSPPPKSGFSLRGCSILTVILI